VLAIHNYHDAQQSFPWGARATTPTWAEQILAFIEQSQMVEQNIAERILSTYTCPSDSNNNKPSNSTLGVGHPHNYVACMGRDGVLFYTATRTSNANNCLIDGVSYAHQSPCNAMFTTNCYNIDGRFPPPLTTTFSDIIDGTSNTIAISETVQGSSVQGGSDFDYRGVIFFSLFCFFNTNLSPNTIIPDIGFSNSNTHIKHPIRLFNMAVGDDDGDYTRMSARSWHVSGVNAGLADGSVRFIPNQIDLEVWQSAGSTNGSEISSLP
jgi:hypothetical protein